jgi:hypothetical protein
MNQSRFSATTLPHRENRPSTEFLEQRPIVDGTGQPSLLRDVPRDPAEPLGVEHIRRLVGQVTGEAHRIARQAPALYSLLDLSPLTEYDQLPQPRPTLTRSVTVEAIAGQRRRLDDRLDDLS